MASLPKAEWRSGPDFAEVAEVLGVRTDQVMALRFANKTTMVLYTPLQAEGREVNREDDVRVFAAALERGDDGIMHATHTPVELPGMWDNIKRAME